MTSYEMGAVGVLLFTQAFGPCAERRDAPAPVQAEAKPAAAAHEEGTRLPKQQTPTPKAFMQSHFAEAEAMRHALIGGRLAELKSAASKMASDDWSENLRPTWKDHLTDVRAAARAASIATSLPEAAEAVGQLGSACAACHRSVGGPPPIERLPEPTKKEDRPMLEHAQAEDWLWRGLAFPSDIAWTGGARALQRAPAMGSDVEEVAVAAHRLESLAARAEPAKENRAELYSEILMTCSACHERVGVAPR